MPYAEVNDTQLYYEEQGEGEPLILLHTAGSMIDAEMGNWRSLLPSLAERYHIIQIESRGHGRSKNPADAITFSRMAEDVCAFIEQYGLAPAHIAGRSDGGVIALQIGLTRPELACTLTGVGANYTVDDQVRVSAEVMNPATIEQERPGLTQTLSRWHDPWQGSGYWRTLVRHLYTNLVTNPTWTAEDLPRITVPTLLIAGENDPFANLDQMVTMKRQIPRAEILIINNAGHGDIQSFVGPALLDFLARHPRVSETP